ncbi:HAMP domain-containing sensor histidine kinase [Cohnella lubricantis]|uniref:histidine kinase n=1 Tax=Cohnella lubricantis TaxID=2163172 RepID=A0A841T9D4_9BACL|nr:HAMP domain-containing sensor histidine kinase [Cohnella lubricantis]MBB6676635.1 HAMP domain-containing histidine kinase [Cohnella lubricantis]MBP2117354.1 signal transduction histidine kinase [Cohnella lubricantis]
MWIWIGLTLGALAVAAASLLRLAFVKRQIRSLTEQLRRYNRHEWAKKMTVGLGDRDVERLAEEINLHTALIEHANAQRRRTEDELRQAVANMSHDLRTPLTSISGYIQLLESDDLTEEQRREAIGIVKNRTARLRALLNDFFVLSVIESTDYELRLESVHLNKLLPELMLGFYDRLSDSKLRPDFRLPEEPLVIVADEPAVRRVVENLLVNAIRHASGVLTVEAARTDRSAVLILSNDAPQLREFDLELLFNRFYMADRSRSSKGAGLGLSIARSLMQKMGGSLTADMDGSRLRMRCEWPLYKTDV